ncbi:hypothetical protein MJO28_006896 [Puccinia striiformis f. sp. tritici]|uniref:Uncharacterized protein n=1 Tax=Puccinia striiformis f. sp. tritici TaxID=168172 RepID=A0ACC0ECH1_9BASI|nr:hypothetical protein MJO28_006896 [Puccinia striiformis f. sp. tritici]
MEFETPGWVQLVNVRVRAYASASPITATYDQVQSTDQPDPRPSQRTKKPIVLAVDQLHSRNGQIEGGKTKLGITQSQEGYVGFLNLNTKYDTYSNWDRFSSGDRLDQASWEAGIINLQASLLPSLRDQITCISRVMDLPGSRKYKGSKLGEISKLQSALDQTLSQFLSLSAVRDGQFLFMTAETEDRHSKHLKCFRVRGLKSKAIETTRSICLLFRDYSDLINRSRSDYVRPTPQFITGSTLSNSTAEVLDSITRIIKWLKGNELDNIQMDWEHHIANIDRSLGRVTRLLDPANYANEPDPGSPLVPPVELVRLTIPIIKLSRLFFSKLIESRKNRTTTQFFTTMSSQQIEALIQEGAHISNGIGDIWQTLRYERGYYEERLDGLLMGVLHQFDTVMRLIILYILPLIPQDPSSEQNLMAWLVDWNNLFLDANKRCIRAYETYGEMLRGY